MRLDEQYLELADTTILVYLPLDVNGVRFYQASWGVTGMVLSALLRVGEKTIPVGMKEEFPVPGQPWTARVEHYLPEFTIGQDGEPSTASLEWKKPALVIGFYNKKKLRIGTLAVGAPSPVTPRRRTLGRVFYRRRPYGGQPAGQGVGRRTDSILGRASEL